MLLKILVADIILHSGKDKLEAVAFLLWPLDVTLNIIISCYLKRVIYNGKKVGFILYLFLKETCNLNCVPQAFFLLIFLLCQCSCLIAWMPYGIMALLSFLWLSPAGSCIWAPDPWPQLLLNLCEASKRFNKRPKRWMIFCCC